MILELTDVTPDEDFCRGQLVMTTIYVYTHARKHLGEFAYSLVHPYVQMMKAGIKLTARVSGHTTRRDSDVFADIFLAV